MVVHADGVEGLRAGGPNTDLMGLLAGHGVRFVVCEDTLRSRSLSEKDFPGYGEVVGSAIVELIVKQAGGWYYIRS